MEIEFIEDGHIYLVDGVITPSVSELIDYHFPQTYASIPNSVLEKSAKYGTKAHELLEAYLKKEMDLNQIKKLDIDSNIINSIIECSKMPKIKALRGKIKSELIIGYKDKYCGTFDILTFNGYVIDIKTTSKKHINNETCEERLNWQIGYYYKALEYMGLAEAKDYGYCLWIPKGKKPELVEVKCPNWELLEENIKQYETR